MSDPRNNMLRIKTTMGLLLDRTPWIGELRALRKKERKVGLDMMEAQRKAIEHLAPKEKAPEPGPKICYVCKGRAVAFIPTEDLMIAALMHPMFSIWSRDRKVIANEFNKHYARFKYKWFCRTHKLGFQEKRFKV